MADDLVERLRDLVDLFPGHPSAGALREAADHFRSASDEIERLRAELVKATQPPTAAEIAWEGRKMTDIVEQLRKWRGSPDFEEAAGEIERLRAELDSAKIANTALMGRGFSEVSR